MPFKINIESIPPFPLQTLIRKEGVTFSLELVHSYGQMDGQTMCHDEK